MVLALTKRRQVCHVELELFHARNFRVDAASVWPKVTNGNIPQLEDAQIQHMAPRPQARIVDKSVNTESGAAFDGASSPSGSNISV